MPQTIQAYTYAEPIPDYDAMIYNAFSVWDNMSIVQQSQLQYLSSKAHWDFQDRDNFEHLYYSLFPRVH